MLRWMRDFGPCGLTLLFAAAAFASPACSSSTGADTIDGGPAIAITSPLDGTSVSIATSTNVAVVFTASGFRLRAPGGCDAIGDGCGHVIVLVDDAACDAPGEKFNDIFPPAGSVDSPATAIADLGHCPSPGGAHTITLQLYRDDHTAVSNGASASVRVTAGSGGGVTPDAGAPDGGTDGAPDGGSPDA
jgi:hypothetical protein